SASPATARASRVLPVPGGPLSSTPRGIRPPSFRYLSGFLRKSTISASSALASSIPATSAKVTRAPVGSYRLALERPKPPSTPPAPPPEARRNTQKRSSRNSRVGPKPKSRLSHHGEPV